MKKNNYQLTKKDFSQINRRNLFSFQLGWNYERMQGSSYLFIILPQLRKIYGDGTPELKEAMKTHNQFFNTSNFFNTIITGIDLALEEKEGADSIETVAGIKSGLMGPFAAIGDSLFAALIPAIMGAIAANLAMQGNAIGLALWMLVNVFIMVFRWKQLRFAYDKGTTLVNEMQGQLNALTNAATLLGVFVVGAMVASMINVQIPFIAHLGKVDINIQDKINLIMPRLVPASIVGIVYWLLGRKKMTSTKVIFIVIIATILLSMAGVLGKG